MVDDFKLVEKSPGQRYLIIYREQGHEVAQSGPYIGGSGRPQLYGAQAEDQAAERQLESA